MSQVIVVGSGNAAFSAALSASERGASVLMLERGGPEWIGGNSWFTAGAYRLAHDGTGDLAHLVEPVDEPIDLASYSEGDYEADMRRLTGGRCDPTLTRVLVAGARDAAEWMGGLGIRWRYMTERQAYRSGAVLRFWGGLAIGTVGGGEGLISAYVAAARRHGVDLQTDSPVVGLLLDTDGGVAGVRTVRDGRAREIEADGVVLASGGFEGSADRRAQYLGEEWRKAKVRGTPHNTGDPLRAAIDAGADAYGDWASCHSIAWDASAPDTGDRTMSNRYSRQAYPFGLVVNRDGRRFLDEGADFRNYTYAKYGAEILRQPGGVAFQLFDQHSLPFISRIDYSTAASSRYESSTIRGLATAAGISHHGLAATLAAYNEGVTREPIDPTILDGRGTRGIVPPKSNWAQPFDQPPYVAFAVTCGITFTFGGLRIDESAAVLNSSRRPIRGLYAAGETVGGLFHGNYPGGTGLASGSVFGRRAGRAAAGAGHQTQSLTPLGSG